MDGADSLVQLMDRELASALRDMNPWWRGERPFGLPRLRRWAFEPMLQRLKGGLAPAVALRGPRRVGKTTLLMQAVTSLLDEGVAPHRIFRIQFDELRQLRGLKTPLLDLCRWFAESVLRKSFNQAAHQGEMAYILLDEVQNLADWAPQLKHLVDIHPVRALVTGSSALRIEAGRDSLAGRIETLEMGPLLLREIAALRGLGELPPILAGNGTRRLREKSFWIEASSHGLANREARDRAFSAFSERGAYPEAQARPDLPWERVADYLNETVVRRAIVHDLRLGSRGRKRDENLLEEVFRLACRYVGQSPKQAMYVEELRQALDARTGWQKILNYLKLLDSTLLLRLVEPLELRLKKQRGGYKLCLCDHMLRAAWLQESIPLTPEGLRRSPHLSDLAGRIAESAAGYFLGSIPNLDLAHFPERSREPEVDFVLTIGEQRIPVEVKYRRKIGHSDTLGLRSFIEKTHYNAPFGILVTLDDEPASDDPRIVSLPLSTLLLLR